MTSRFPYPLEKGDKLRAYHHIRHLSRKHDVCLVALNEEPVPEDHIRELEAFCSEVHVFVLPRFQRFTGMLTSFLRGESLQIGYFLSRRIKSKVQDLILSMQPDHVYCQLVRAAPYVALLPVAKSLDYMDVFSVAMRQRAERANVFLSPFFRYEAVQLAKAERDIYKYFDHHAVISSQDRDRLPLTYHDSVLVVPNGVDADFFVPVNREKSADIVFVGNMGYLPNIEAAEYLVRQVMPHVWDTVPEATVRIAGARPHKRVRKLASGRVEVTGWVEDIRDAYGTSRIFVGTIFSGIGQQNKILEAMAMGLPCVTSSIVNNAIGAKHRQQVLVANDAVAFAKAVLELLDDHALVQEIGTNARRFIVEQYLWEVQNKKLDKLFIEKEEAVF